MFDLWSENEILRHFVPQNDSVCPLVTDFVDSLSPGTMRFRGFLLPAGSGTEAC